MSRKLGPDWYYSVTYLIFGERVDGFSTSAPGNVILLYIWTNFRAGHILGAVQIPATSRFSHFRGVLIICRQGAVGVSSTFSLRIS
jgi:hypothetical protein